MIGYIGRRALQTVFVLTGMTLIVFFMIHLVPGDPARTLLGPQAPIEAVERLRSQWGLDLPLHEQLIDWTQRVVTGDFGESLTIGIPVGELIASRLPPTLLLVAYSAILGFLITIPLAVVAATRENRVEDHVIRAGPIIALGMPSFWLGILLLQVFAVQAGWFPVGGYGETMPEHLRALFLPAVTVAVALSPFTIRSLRASLIDVLDSDHVVTARAKRLPKWRILSRHGLRVAILPTITVFGLNVGHLVGSTIVVEKVFAIPGLGSLMIDAVLLRDFAVVQALTLVLGILVVLVNVTTDLVHAWLDPRVRLAQ